MTDCANARMGFRQDPLGGRPCVRAPSHDTRIALSFPVFDMPRTRVKVCGITRPEDALAAARCGADAIGLVFYDASPRAVDVPAAQAITAVLPPFVSTVALFVDAPPERVRAVLEAVPVDLVQLHGDEPPEACRAVGKPYVKALRMRPGRDVREAARAYGDARGLLLDTYRPGVPGGTGAAFDWSEVPHDLPLPVILAGGLEPGNVADAIARVHPYAVDVSGGVEQSKGRKDPAKIEAFLAAVRRADAGATPDTSR
jgi:phosphoribosylanthranilate isomerase